MFNVTTGVYESHQSPFSGTQTKVKKQGSHSLDFQVMFEKADSDTRSVSARTSEAESLSASREALAKPKSNPTTQQYEPLPEGCEAPKVSGTIHAMYCEARAPSSSTWQPNWDAADSRQTIGGHGDTDGSGNTVLWGQADRRTLAAGEVFDTPAGNYQVVTNKWGDLVLRPLDDAWRGSGEQFRSLTVAEHHIGVHPKTGEVWYQTRA